MQRDPAGAVSILEEKAQSGHREAMWMLGLCCEYGMGTPEDKERALSLYIGSMEKKCRMGMLFAFMLGEDRGVKFTLKGLWQITNQQFNLSGEKKNGIKMFWVGETGKAAMQLEQKSKYWLLCLNTPLTQMSFYGERSTKTKLRKHCGSSITNWQRAQSVTRKTSKSLARRSSTTQISRRSPFIVCSRSPHTQNTTVKYQSENES